MDGLLGTHRVKPATDQRLFDHISIAVLTGVPSPQVVDRVIAKNGRKQVRHRLLPGRVVVYYVLGLAPFADTSRIAPRQDLRGSRER
jgi:hypothetical protein